MWHINCSLSACYEAPTGCHMVPPGNCSTLFYDYCVFKVLNTSLEEPDEKAILQTISRTTQGIRVRQLLQINTPERLHGIIHFQYLTGRSIGAQKTGVLPAIEIKGH